MKSPILSYLEELHARFLDDRSGTVADYIPELGNADPELFGICVATTDGRVYEVGDSRHAFTIQSMSKPFTYGLALQDRGREAVRAKVSVEPSGDAFNEISLDPTTGRPLNAMINAGAITATSLVAGDTPQERFARLLGLYSSCAGRPLEVDEQVFRSERDTGHRNRAIGYMLRTFEILRDEPEDTLGLYFRQCAVSVDARDMSVMAATLANGGRNPVTGERAFHEPLIERVLSVMTTCGMYDGSGAWVDGVGLPAKSGVAGGIFAVLPGQLGVAVFSPRLDEHGNSVRGVKVCQALAEELQLHFLHVARSARSTIRVSYDLTGVPSRRRRSRTQMEVLAEAGARAVVYELQGDLLFSGTERVVRVIVDRADDIEVAVLDIRAVDDFDGPAARTLLRLRDEFIAEGKSLAFVAHGGRAGLAGAADIELEASVPIFRDPDDAREWAEQVLLVARGLGDALLDPVSLGEHQVCRDFTPAQLRDLRALLVERSYPDGDLIIEAGEDATAIFFLLEGEVDVSIPVGDGSRRLASLPPGSTFGELAVLGHAKRTADVTANGDVTLVTLDAAVFDELALSNPALQAAVLRNLLSATYEVVDRMTREVAALARDA